MGVKILNFRAVAAAGHHRNVVQMRRRGHRRHGGGHVVLFELRTDMTVEEIDQGLLLGRKRVAFHTRSPGARGRQDAVGLLGAPAVSWADAPRVAAVAKAC